MQTKARPTDQPTEREQRNRQLSYEAATEGIVLLENHGILPISPCPIALYGAGAGYTIKGGSGSGEVNVRHTITVQEGLEQAGFTILTTDWIKRYDTLWQDGKAAFLRKVRRKLWWPTPRRIDEVMGTEYLYPSGDLISESELNAIATDTCIYVLSRQSGEGHDLEDRAGSFRMDETEIANIRLCAGHFARFILLINTGTPIDLTAIDDIQEINAIVYMSEPGMEAGSAVAAILTGKNTPSGRLAVSWPRSYHDVPYGQDFAVDPTATVYKEGIYVGYRYYDSFDVSPRYPFGYGLSYTDFKIDKPVVTVQGDTILIHVRVTNIGKTYAGKQVVQVYVRCPGEDKEYQRLVAFAKTKTLHPAESEELELRFAGAAMAHYDENSAQMLLDAGKYLVRIGCSSRDSQNVAVLQLDEQVVISKHRNLCTATRHIAELTHSNIFEVPAGLKEIKLDISAFKQLKTNYCTEETVPSVMENLSDKDCIRFCAGAGMSGEKGGFRTPGAVGHTTTAYISQDIRNVQMCDGPAGIRIERRSVRYPDGDIKPVDVSLSIYEYLPPFLLKWLVLGNPNKGEILYQYVTAFPIEAMVAQTWNTTLAERIGQAVSEEMSEYGVTFWLAPAMNIVRNPLCGRNYEYYSEDPILTGMMATAVTRGVQTIAGNYVTLKHFCANNQEAYRHTMSSEVDERALREIYWRGFEMVIRETHPHAVMAAYNRLNGIFCANNPELCIDLLRGEWGFEGIVMTDWYSTGNERADEVSCIQSGVDLIMPGGKKDVQTLTKAYEAGMLSSEDLRRAAARVIRTIMK